MLRPLAVLVALLLSCAAFAQGTGLKLPKGAAKTPATKSDPAPATSTVEVPAASPGETNAGVESVEKIFACLSAGLPKDWRSATVEVTEIASSGLDREFEARYTYTRTPKSKPQRLEPCDTTGPAKDVHALNDFLEPEKRLWKRAMLTFNKDGKFELKYDYTK